MQRVLKPFPSPQAGPLSSYGCSSREEGVQTYMEDAWHMVQEELHMVGASRRDYHTKAQDS